jgi:hypothetical protein
MNRTAALLASVLALLPATSPAASWTIQPTPSPAGSDAVSTLVSVSCSAPSACTAVGQHIDRAGNETTLAERWNGLRWSVQRTPMVFTGFGSVSCPGASECIAVGGTGPVLAERWNGLRWSVLRPVTPLDGTAASLISVSCPAARVCLAVGAYFYRGRHQRQIAERWDGRRWLRLHVPDPPGAGAFFAVSCSSPRACTAVGNYTNGRRQYPFAERWNGRAWSRQRIPDPGGHTMLLGVSCPSGSSCTAVGLSQDSAATRAIAARWTPGRWRLSRPAAPSGVGPAGAELHGISCWSARHCVAVGQYDRGGIVTRTLAQRWTGRRWVAEPTPGRAGQDSNFWSVSCPSSDICTAVGDHTGPVRDTLTLAEHRRDG